MSASTVSTRLAQIAEYGQQCVMRLGWERPRSLALRRVLTNRMREFFTYGSVGGAGGNPGSYPAANGGWALRLLLRRRPAVAELGSLGGNERERHKGPDETRIDIVALRVVASPARHFAWGGNRHSPTPEYSDASCP